MHAILLRKLILLVLLIVGVALGLAILFKQVHSASFFLQIFLSNLLMGLVSGFSARNLFRKHMGLLRFFSACVAYICGILLLGFFSGWQVGIGPYQLHNRSTDWAALGQLLIGIGTIALTLEAWQRPVEVVVSPPQRIVTAIPRAARQPSARRSRRSRAATPKVKAAPAIAVAVPVKSRRKRVYHRKPQLQLSVEVDHRCPYCLEEVKPNDPRGTVECKVCHTLHHADCWAITGTCQVPHLNN